MTPPTKVLLGATCLFPTIYGKTSLDAWAWFKSRPFWVSKRTLAVLACTVSEWEDVCSGVASCW